MNAFCFFFFFNSQLKPVLQHEIWCQGCVKRLLPPTEKSPIARCGSLKESAVSATCIFLPPAGLRSACPFGCLCQLVDDLFTTLEEGCSTHGWEGGGVTCGTTVSQEQRWFRFAEILKSLSSSLARVGVPVKKWHLSSHLFKPHIQTLMLTIEMKRR